MSATLLFTASPHAGGVTETIAAFLVQGVRRVDPACRLLHLRDFTIRPCSGCGHCQASPHLCPLDGDDAKELLLTFAKAPYVLFLAPIYYYALPASAKALVDRAQRFWQAKRNDPSPLLRPTAALLCGARKEGDSLFTGTLLTLRYFFQSLGRELTETETLRGVETVNDIPKEGELAKKIVRIGEMWAKKAVAHYAER